MTGANADLHGDESRRSRLTRRAVSIPAVFAVAAGLTLSMPLWLPIAVAADLLKLKPRLPLTRLLLFGTCWAWIEIAGLVRSFGAWVTGRAGNRELHYELMTWWTNALMGALRATTGLEVVVEGRQDVAKGDAIVLCRHASLADSLVTAWVFCSSGLEPRYVLKRELLADPCLDVVGHRVPNVFIDRAAPDGGPELAKMSALADGLGSQAVCVIFPEGTRVSDAKRERALSKITERDAERAERMAALTHLLPPRPAGTTALLAGAPDADVVLMWHTGFDGLHDFRGILQKLAHRPAPVKVAARRVPRADVPSYAGVAAWLDEQWLRMDAEVRAELGACTVPGGPARTRT